jgi:hypothetical protein
MPSRKPQNNTPQKPQQPIPNSQTPAIGFKSQNSGQEQEGSRQIKNYEQGDNNPRTINIGQIPKIDVIEGTEANGIARSANKISIISTVVGVALLIATFLVFQQASKQTRAALTADSIAQASLTASKKYNDSVGKSQKIFNRKIDSTDSIRNKIEEDKSTLQKRFTDTQIKFLVKNQNNVEKSNAPYLEVSDIKFTQMAPNKPVNIDLTLVNLGVYPAKIKKMFIGSVFRDNIPPFFVTENTNKKNFTNKYITKEKDSKFPLPNVTPILGETVYNEFINGQYSYYLEGDIIYENLFTNKERRYKFILSVNKDGLIGYPKSENSDIK